MTDSLEKIKKIKSFITNYIIRSKERGNMYGSIAELESNWDLLDHIYCILEELEDVENDCNFTAFLLSKGYGVKSAASIIKEIKSKDPYTELNKLRNEYEEWRSKKIEKLRQKDI